MHTNKKLLLESKTNLFVEILVLGIISWQLTILINAIGGETKYKTCIILYQCYC